MRAWTASRTAVTCQLATIAVALRTQRAKREANRLGEEQGGGAPLAGGGWYRVGEERRKEGIAVGGGGTGAAVTEGDGTSSEGS